MAFLKSKWEWTLLVLGVLLLVIGLSYGLADWKGNATWERYKHEWEAKGEKFDFKDFVPPPVPDDQNFALTPVVASSYDAVLDKTGHRLIPPRTNLVDRMSMDIESSSHAQDFPDSPMGGNWAVTRSTDLAKWQQYYRLLSARTNEFPVSSQPQSPAADVLLALSRFDPVIEEIRAAGQRPLSRYPLNYDADPPCSIMLPHLDELKACGQVLRLRAIADLEQGANEKAFADLELIWRLADAITNEPFAISHFTRLSIINIGIQVVWEGLAAHRWSETQLIRVDDRLGKLSLLKDRQAYVRAERTVAIGTVDYMRRTRQFYSFEEYSPGDRPENIALRFFPESVFYKNELNLARGCQQWGLPAINAEQHEAYPRLVALAATNSEQQFSHFSLNTMFVRIFAGSFDMGARRVAYSQNAVDMARIACALERYRIAQGGYPDSLEVLSPRFIEKPPHDVIGGQPLRYRRQDGDAFTLYSIGWNEVDDGGAIVLYESHQSNVDIAKGDWVWQYPTNRIEQKVTK
jgi:hypothetical protein